MTLSLRHKLILFICGLSLFTAAIFYLEFFSDRNILPVYISREAEAEKKTFSRIFELKNSSLRSFILDYSIWDELVNFISSRNRKWALENINPALDSFKLNYIWVYSPEGQLIYSASNKDQERAAEGALPKEVLKGLISGADQPHFFISANNRIMEIRGAAVRLSADYRRTGAVFGFIFGGKTIDKEYLSELARATETHLSLKPAGDMRQDASGYFFKNNFLSFWLPLEGWDRSPVAYVAVDKFIPVAGQLQRIIKHHNIFLVCIELVFTLLFILFLTFWVIVPLHRIAIALKTGDPSFVSSLKFQKDEIGRIAQMIFQFNQEKSAVESMYKVIPSAVFTVDRNRRIVSWNDRASEITGYSAEEVVGKECFFFGDITCKDKCILREEEARAPLMGKECYVRTKDKKIKFIIKNVDLLRDKSGTVIGTIESFDDITDLRRAEEELKNSREQLFRVINTIPDSIFVKDRKHRFILVNQAFCDAFGGSADSFVGKTADDFLLSPEGVFARQKDEEVFSGKNGISYEQKMTLKGLERCLLITKSLYTDFLGNEFLVGIFKDMTEQKKAQEALENSEHKYSVLVESHPLGVIILQDERIKYANRTMSERFGYSIDEYYKMHMKEVFAPEVRDRIMQNYYDRMSGKFVNPFYESKLLRKDGSIIDVELSATIIEYEGKSADIVVLRDITAAKRMHRALLESERRYATLVDNITLGVAVIQNEKFRFVNKAMLDLFGYSHEEFMRLAIDRLPAPAEREKCVARYHQRMKGDDCLPAVFESQFMRKDGTFIDVEYAAAIMEIEGSKADLLVVRDITHQKRMEASLRKAVHEWRTTFDSIEDLVSIHDPDCRILKVNQAFSEALNMKPEDLVGRRCFDLIHENKAPPYACPAKATFKTGKAATEELFEPKLNKFLQVSTSPMRDAQGAVIGVVHVVKDVTKRRRSEEELQAAYNQLKDAQDKLVFSEKMAALGRFASGIAHEVKNPLGIILGGVEFLEKKIGKDADGDILVTMSKVKESISRADEVLKSLLQFSRPSRLELEEADPNDLIRNTVPLLKFKPSSSRVRMEYALGDGLKVYIDRNQIMQVLFNIAVNAIEAMPDGGEVIFRTYRKYFPDISKEELCVIEIEDTGTGIEQAQMSKIFEPFFTTKLERKGTGLGLYVSKNIVNNHHGELVVESQPQKGTKVRIILPLFKD